MTTATLPDLISDAQTTEEALPAPHLRPRPDGRVVEERRSSWPGPTASITGTSTASATSTPCPASTSSRSATTTAASSTPSASSSTRCTSRRRCTAPTPSPCSWPTCWPSWPPATSSAVKFQCGGSEVTEAAIKLARQYHKLTGNPGKYKIISRYQSWHGSTMGSLSASGLKSRKTVNEPLAPGFLHVFPPTCYRCPFGKTYPDCGITCATLVDDVIEMEDPATVAAVMVEPIGHTGGIIDPPPEYLPILREICDRHNILLIFDEIITGVGRTGQMFAAETFGVMPDVICTAKGLSGGYAPLSAMICRAADRRRLLGADRREPRLRRGAHLRGQPDLLRRRASPCCARSSSATCAATPATQGAAAAGRLRAAGRRSTASSATSAARDCSRASSSSATRRRRSASRRAGVRRAGRPAGAGRTACCAASTRTGSPSARRWSSTAEQIDEMLAMLDRSMGEVLN